MADAKLPASVTVGPYRVSIVAEQAAIDRKSVELDGRMIGHFDGASLTITLDPNAAPDFLAETLLHELLHAVSEASGKPLGIDSDDEERVIRCWSPVLLDTLRRNPHLRDFLFPATNPKG